MFILLIPHSTISFWLKQKLSRVNLITVSVRSQRIVFLIYSLFYVTLVPLLNVLTMTWETWLGRLLMYSASYSFLLYYSTSAAVWFETWQEKHDRGFPGGAVVENLPANAGDTGSCPDLGGSHMPRSNWAREPQLLSLRIWSLCSATREAAIVRGPRTTMKSGPRLPQLEKALAQKRRPNTAINK